MAATALPVTTITHTGVAGPTPPTTDITNGNQLATNNGTTTFVRAVNTVATAATVTLKTIATADGNTISSKVYNLPATANAEVWFVVGSPDLYGTTPLVTASATTVTLYAYQV